MIRAITSIVAASALLAILTADACAACWAPVQKATHCCHPAGHCDTAGKTPAHRECASQAVDLGSVEQPAAHVVIIEPVSYPAPVAIVSVAPHFDWRLSDTDPYSPPDLCVLNSVFTI